MSKLSETMAELQLSALAQASGYPAIEKKLSFEAKNVVLAIAFGAGILSVGSVNANQDNSLHNFPVINLIQNSMNARVMFASGGVLHSNNSNTQSFDGNAFSAYEITNIERLIAAIDASKDTMYSALMNFDDHADVNDAATLSHDPGKEFIKSAQSFHLLRWKLSSLIYSMALPGGGSKDITKYASVVAGYSVVPTSINGASAVFSERLKNIESRLQRITSDNTFDHKSNMKVDTPEAATPGMIDILGNQPRRPG